MHLNRPLRAAAVLLATAAVPLPLHDADGKTRARHRHRHHHARRAAARLPVHRRHHRATEIDLPGLAATTTARDARATRARAAGDPGDTISDFKFAPAAITVHVGDTITWTNDGPSPHSATANNRSFDTGVLKQGQSASHTFSQAGTFTYFCTVHPFMHGTVVVVADNSSSASGSTSGSGSSTGSSGAGSGSSGAGSSTSSSGAGSGAPAAGTTTATSAQGTLPLTGMDSAAVVAIGLALAGGGLAIRRRVRSQH